MSCKWDHVNNKKCFFTCLYRSSSQNHDEIEHFCTNFDLLLSNVNNFYPTCSIVLCDFNAKCSKWFTSDKNNTSGIELDNITMTSGYNQMIDTPIHYINVSSSCTDLILSWNMWKYLKIVELNNHFTKNVIITLSMET